MTGVGCPIFMLDTTRAITDVVVSVITLGLLTCGVTLDFCNNPARRSTRYRIRRTINWLVLGFYRVLQIQARYSFPALATKEGAKSLNLSSIQLSWVLTLGLWIVPIGMVVLGYSADRFGEKLNVYTCIIVQIIITIAFGFVVRFAQETAFLTVCSFAYYVSTSFLQGASEILLTKNNAAWYGKSDRTAVAGIFTLCVSVGYLFGFAGNSMIVQITSTHSALFFINGSLLFLSLVLLFFFFKVYTEANKERGEESYQQLPQTDYVQMQDTPVENKQEEQQPVAKEDAASSTGLISNQDKPENERVKTLSEVLLNWQFVVYCACFWSSGYLRDSFFFYLNPYLTERYGLGNGSASQIISFSALTVGTAFSAFVSVILAKYFEDRSGINGMFCSWMVLLAAIIFAASQYLPISIIIIGFYTMFNMAIFGIRRTLSVTLGGYDHAGVVTGILGAASFFGGGCGSLISEIVLREANLTAWTISLIFLSIFCLFSFGISAKLGREFEQKSK